MKKFLFVVLFCILATGVSANSVSSFCPCLETYPVEAPVLLDIGSVSGEYWGDFHSKLFGSTMVACDYFPSSPWSSPIDEGWFCTDCCYERLFVSGSVNLHDDFIADVRLTIKMCCGEKESFDVDFTAFWGVEYQDAYSAWQLDASGNWAFYIVYLKEGTVYVSATTYEGNDTEAYYVTFALVPANLDYVAIDYPVFVD